MTSVHLYTQRVRGRRPSAQVQGPCSWCGAAHAEWQTNTAGLPACLAPYGPKHAAPRRARIASSRQLQHRVRARPPHNFRDYGKLRKVYSQFYDKNRDHFQNLDNIHECFALYTSVVCHQSTSRPASATEGSLLTAQGRRKSVQVPPAALVALCSSPSLVTRTGRSCPTRCTPRPAEKQALIPVPVPSVEEGKRTQLGSGPTRHQQSQNRLRLARRWTAHLGGLSCPTVRVVQSMDI